MSEKKIENYKLQLTLPSKMHDNIKTLSEKKGIAVNAVIRIAISEYLEKEGIK